MTKTLRDEIALEAMKVLSGSYNIGSSLTNACYRQADAMLAAKSRHESNGREPVSRSEFEEVLETLSRLVTEIGKEDSTLFYAGSYLWEAEKVVQKYSGGSSVFRR